MTARPQLRDRKWDSLRALKDKIGDKTFYVFIDALYNGDIGPYQASMRITRATGMNCEGFIAGRTATAEHIEQAARHVRDGDDPDSALPRSVQWDRISEETREDYRQEIQALFAAAGFLVEEDR